MLSRVWRVKIGLGNILIDESHSLLRCWTHQQWYSCSLFSSPCAARPRGLQCSLYHPGHRSEPRVTVIDGTVLCKDGGGCSDCSAAVLGVHRLLMWSGSFLQVLLCLWTSCLVSAHWITRKCIVLSGQKMMLPSCRPALYWVLWTLVPALTPPRPPPRPAEGLLPTYLEVQWYYILLTPVHRVAIPKVSWTN